MENFGMMIPKYAIYYINGCRVFNSKSEDFEKFKKWVETEIKQLTIDGEQVDYWYNTNKDSRLSIMSLNDWFKEWVKRKIYFRYDYIHF